MHAAFSEGFAAMIDRSKAIIIGNSDGIGLETTKRLLGADWNVVGISRSKSPIDHVAYSHFVCDVAHDDFSNLLDEQVRVGVPGLFIYAVGIGELLDLESMGLEAKIFDVNLLAMIRAASIVIPAMLECGEGHFIGISSLADDMISAEAPSYHASKAGFSNYLEGLALALKPYENIHVTNVRFGFVDTKMAKGDVKPFMMSVGKAADHMERCIARKPPVYTAPKIAVPLVKFRKMMLKLAIR
jgi:short-subunit dehydrogenase